MTRFFHCSKFAPNASTFTKFMTTFVRDFQLATSPRHHGKIVKILLSKKCEDMSDVWKNVQENIVKSNPHSLFVWTAPTYRSQGHIHPGHNFSSVTDETGEIVSFMSKTPDSAFELKTLERVPDKRFENFSPTMRAYKPLFTSVHKEVKKWAERASSVPGYPLYLHIIPLLNEQALNQYKNNVNEIVEFAEPYRLVGSIHPDWDQYIPASNCNSALAESILGKELSRNSTPVHDLSCQDAAMKIVLKKFVKDTSHYIMQCNALGLTTGIEPPTIPEERYRTLFTC